MSSIAETTQPPVDKNSLARQQDNIAQLSEISRNSRTTFMAMILACVYSFLAIATTTDAALLSNSSATPLPIIQANVPIVWFYYFAPIILAVLFIYFHLYLERFWRCVALLPLRHPDGRGLDDYIYPWLISNAIIRGEIRELSVHRFSARIEAWLSLLLAWWLVPIVLLFYWARFLVAHDWAGTLLHIGLIVLLAGFALRFFFSAKNALRRMASEAEHPTGARASVPGNLPALGRTQLTSAAAGLAIVGVVLAYLSAATILGLPQEVCSKAGLGTRCALYGPGRAFWHAVGVEPYVDVNEQRFVGKPKEWQSLLSNGELLRSHLESQQTLVLIARDLRSMSAADAFLPGSRLQGVSLDYADLRHAAMTASRLERVTLAGTNLTDADLRHARIDDSHFDDVVAQAARFEHASFASGRLEDRTRLSGDFSGAHFDGARGENLLFGTQTDSGAAGGPRETTLREASLKEATFTWSTFSGIDFGAAMLDGATLTNNVFSRADFSGAGLRGAFLDGSTFTKCRFVSSRIEDSTFEETSFLDSEIGPGPSASTVSSDAANPSPPQVQRDQIVKFHGFSALFGEHTRIRDVEFSGADLRNARFEDVELKNVLFANSDLSGATFERVDLSDVEFKNVDLTAADLSKSKGVLPRLLKGACGNAETRLPPGLKMTPCKAH